MMSLDKKKLTPEKEFNTKDNYCWFVYGENDTGFRLVCLEDRETKPVLTTPLANL